MKAILHHLHSPDAPELGRYNPGPGPFSMLIQANIGPDSGEGWESFDFVVCNASWLSGEVAEHAYRLGRHLLIVDRFDLGLIRRVIEDICADATGPDWPDIARQLARYGRWEFEDYREHP